MKQQKKTQIPLVANRHISQFAPKEYKKHIESLYEDCPLRKEKREANLPKVIFKWTKTGNPSILISKREPKYLTEAEFQMLTEAHKLPKNILFLYLKKRQIELRPGAECRVTPASLSAVRPDVVPKAPKPKAKKKAAKKKGKKNANKS